jgi:hypothetical protein
MRLAKRAAILAFAACVLVSPMTAQRFGHHAAFAAGGRLKPAPYGLWRHSYQVFLMRTSTAKPPFWSRTPLSATRGVAWYSSLMT